MSIKLNIGAGRTVIDGFTPIDRKIGLEAFPLNYPDNSVEEIRASHILEHFSFREALEALKEWARVLKPGGKIRIAVPGFEEVVQLAQHDSKWPFYLMGGQTDENDFHKSVWNRSTLQLLLQHVGLANVQPWQSANTDCAALPCSLNLEAYKPLPTAADIKVCAVMSIPRVGWNDAWGQVLEALAPLRIPVRRFNGAFWGQCMQRSFNECVKDGVDWILTIDYDSMFTSQHVDTLLGTFGSHPEIDALAALQQRRGQGFPLMTCGRDNIAAVTNDPLRVTTAHFGLTLIRVDALKQVAKPWFYAQPDQNGEWTIDGDKLDDDIWFWHQWRLAGKSVYVDPNCRIGHLELMVAEFTHEMQPRHVYVTQWRKENGYAVEDKKDGSQIDTSVGPPSAGNGDNPTGQLSGEFDPARRVSPSFVGNDGAGSGDGSASGNGHVAECAEAAAI